MTQPDASKIDLFASTAVSQWKINLDRLNKMFDAFSDEELQQEIAPGKNRIFYLLGHLTAVHDRMLPLLRLGMRLHVELDQDFLTNPDRTTPDRISAGALRNSLIETGSFSWAWRIRAGVSSKRNANAINASTDLKIAFIAFSKGYAQPSGGYSCFDKKVNVETSFPRFTWMRIQLGMFWDANNFNHLPAPAVSPRSERSIKRTHC